MGMYDDTVMQRDIIIGTKISEAILCQHNKVAWASSQNNMQINCLFSRLFRLTAEQEEMLRIVEPLWGFPSMTFQFLVDFVSSVNAMFIKRYFQIHINYIIRFTSIFFQIFFSFIVYDRVCCKEISQLWEYIGFTVSPASKSQCRMLEFGYISKPLLLGKYICIISKYLKTSDYTDCSDQEFSVFDWRTEGSISP